MSSYLGRTPVAQPFPVRYVTSDPDGVVTAPRGTLAINTTTGGVYRNTDGATAWKSMVAAAPRMGSGRYWFVPNAVSVTNATLGTGFLRVVPYDITNVVVLTKIGAEVTTIGDVGSKFRLGIYADDGNNRPGALVVDAGTINGDSATVQELTISVTLDPGRYWFGGATQAVTATQPRLAIPTTGSIAPFLDIGSSIPTTGQALVGWSQSGVTGALPATFTDTPSAAGAVPRIFIKT